MKSLPCDEALLLFSDLLAGAISAEEAESVETHLESCPSCRELAAGYGRLDRVLAELAVQDKVPRMLAGIRAAVANEIPLPTPALMDDEKSDGELLSPEKVEPEDSAPAVQPSVSRRAVFRKVAWATAACLVVTAGLALFFAVFPQRVEANPDLLDRLAEWNLDISSAPTRAERQDRFQERANAFDDDLANADLRGDEREMAAALLANARTMGAEKNPLDVAERLDGMSEKMLTWMGAHSNTNPKRALAMERHYLRFVERSLGIVQRIEANGAPDAIQAERMERVMKRIAKRAMARVDEDAERSRKKSKR